MVEAVFIFAAMLAVFEFVLLCMIPPRIRLRVLGNRIASGAIHIAMLIVNLYVHWGTVTGTMSATGAFIVSIVVIEIAKLLFGTIVDGKRARRGLFGYRNEELM